MPLVIGVACGKQKAAAIVGAARGGYVKALVTDDVTATEVLALASSVASGLPGGTVAPSVDVRCSERTRGPRSERAPAVDQTFGDEGALGQALLAHGRRGPSDLGR